MNFLVQTQELLADITVLEVAVLKLEEQSATLQRELGQARTEREIAELRHASKHSMRVQGPLLHPTFPDSNNVTTEEIQTSGSPVRISHSKEQGQKLLVAPSLTEETAQPPHSSGDLCISSHGDEPDQSEQAQNTWKVCCKCTFYVEALSIHTWFIHSKSNFVLTVEGSD
jgi:hypothetical protein